MSIKGVQFWLLVACSTVATLLMIKQAFLSRDIVRQQRVVVEMQQATVGDGTYEAAWQQLAAIVWKSSATDPALVELLKTQKITVRQKGSPVASLPATNAAPVAAVPLQPSPTSHAGSH